MINAMIVIADRFKVSTMIIHSFQSNALRPINREMRQWTTGTYSLKTESFLVFKTLIKTIINVTPRAC